MITRRQFVRAGLVGGALLALGGGAWLWQAKRARHAATAAEVALGEAPAILGALAPALLEGALPQPGPERQAALARSVQGTLAAIRGLPVPVQGELAQLFGLLAFAPARWALTGRVKAWPEIDAEDAARVLERWRSSRFQLLRSAYHAFHDLVLGSWYADERSWPAIGYPGPPQLG
jgi:hypothetical protein